MYKLFQRFLFSLLIFSSVFSQINYRSVDEIESEWGGYASFQKRRDAYFL